MPRRPRRFPDVRRDGEIVVAEQEEIVVLQGVIGIEDGVEVCEIAVDEVAQRDGRRSSDPRR